MTDPNQTPPETPASPEAPPDESEGGATRRQFLATATVGSALLLEACSHAPVVETPAEAPKPPVEVAPAHTELDITLTINGQQKTVKVDPRTSLLDALRERLHLTGTKKGCDHGQCGACTVLVDNRRELSCLSLAVMHQGATLQTVEGLAEGDTLHPLQQAFLEQDAFQCGYCTPGQLMSAAGLLKEPCGASDNDVREAMSGNICRCSAYPNIIAAIQQVRRLPKQ